MLKSRYGLLALALAVMANACTVGVFSGRVTADHRPMIWKNRDVDNSDQAVHYFTDGRYPYLANVYACESEYAWSGVNQAGFAIMNANSFNLGSGAPHGIGDGEVMKLALQTCATIDDFRRLLDSLNLVGRGTPCNLGVMDASGATAMFEAGANSYTAWYSESLAEGYIVRANFSLCADTAGEKSNNRYLRASQLVARGKAANELDSRWLIENVARDLGQTDFDPYPLPYADTVGTLPYGFLPASTTISRYKTRSTVVIAGPRPGEPVSLSVMWTMLGEPTVAAPVPLWVAAQSVPEPLADQPTARLCDEAQRMSAHMYSDSRYASAINSFRLVEVNEALGPTFDTVRESTGEQLDRWAEQPPTPGECAAFQNEMASSTLAAYQRFWSVQPKADIQVPETTSFHASVVPGNSMIEVVVPAGTGSRRLRFCDVNGRGVADFALAPAACRFDWQPDRLSNGLYFVTLESGKTRETRSFCLLR